MCLTFSPVWVFRSFLFCCVVQSNHGGHFEGRWLPNMSWNLRRAPPVPQHEEQVRATSLKSRVFLKKTELCNFFSLKYLGAMLSTLESTNTEIHFSHITRWGSFHFFLKTFQITTWDPNHPVSVHGWRLRGDQRHEVQPHVRLRKVWHIRRQLHPPRGEHHHQHQRQHDQYHPDHHNHYEDDHNPQGERVVLANCKKALINGTVMLPSAALSNSKYAHTWLSWSWYSWWWSLWSCWWWSHHSPPLSLNKMMAACSDIKINKEMNSIEVVLSMQSYFWFWLKK